MNKLVDEEAELLERKPVPVQKLANVRRAYQDRQRTVESSNRLLQKHLKVTMLQILSQFVLAFGLYCS